MIGDEVMKESTKYRRKSPIVEVIQWKGDNKEEVCVFCPEIYFYNGKGKLGGADLVMDDFVVKAKYGFYLCSPEHFNEQYERI